MYSDKKEIKNTTDNSLNVFIEPCALDVDIPVGETYSFISTSEIKGNFELEKTENGFTIWGWEGTDIKVKHSDEVIFETDLRFPILGIKSKKWWQIWK